MYVPVSGTVCLNFDSSFIICLCVVIVYYLNARPTVSVIVVDESMCWFAGRGKCMCRECRSCG